MTCVTEGGNPLPTLVWLRNGLPLNERSMLDQIDAAAAEAKATATANAAGAATAGGSKCNDEEAKCTFGLSTSSSAAEVDIFFVTYVCDIMI